MSAIVRTTCEDQSLQAHIFNLRFGNSRNTAQAVDFLEGVIQQRGAPVCAHLALATYFYHRAPRRALVHLETALIDAPDNVDAIYELAHLLLSPRSGIARDTIRAGLLCDRILQIDGADVRAKLLKKQISRMNSPDRIDLGKLVFKQRPLER